MPVTRMGPECREPGCRAPIYEDGRCQPHWAQAQAFPQAANTEAPKAIAYLSDTGFSITLEITGGERFTLADVDAAIGGVQARRRAA